MTAISCYLALISTLVSGSLTMPAIHYRRHLTNGHFHSTFPKPRLGADDVIQIYSEATAVAVVVVNDHPVHWSNVICPSLCCVVLLVEWDFFFLCNILFCFFFSTRQVGKKILEPSIPDNFWCCSSSGTFFVQYFISFLLLSATSVVKKNSGTVEFLFTR